ncbi:hypothetical protein FRC11_009748 [Ceratobasidium sp. 423]|nr:hypothetical protein FRC11_009748 [Ceratobasidium sp. 423]
MKYAFTAAALAATIRLAVGVAVEPRQSASFVKTSGQQFTLGGQKYTAVGLSNNADITKAFSDLKNAGFTTLRTWGFNEVTSPSGTYYQIWNGKTATLNTGADGLQKFDTVVAQAKAAGIRLIVALTNNWQDYGGMDVYVRQLLGSDKHDLFYTDSAVKDAFKKYISGFVGQYKNEPTIMAWELANEPRCRGSTGSTTGSCTTQTITQWATEMSAYIKSIAPNQLVAIGDEGFYNQPSAPTYPYQGSEGVDFDANLKISSIDFGTFHSYPEHWGQGSNVVGWGTQWIKDHAASQKSANKPVILEEFGVTSSYNPSNTYTTWWDTIISSGLTGDLIWQAGSFISSGSTPDDGFTVYPNEPEYALQTKYAAALKARN